MENYQSPQEFEETKNKHLVYSLVIDFLGYGSYLIPVLAEVTDIIYAPVSAILIYSMYKSKVGSVGGFIEEILPGTDIIPSATLVWFFKYHVN